jgi:hypothetical protein
MFASVAVRAHGSVVPGAHGSVVPTAHGSVVPGSTIPMERAPPKSRNPRDHLIKKSKGVDLRLSQFQGPQSVKRAVSEHPAQVYVVSPYRTRFTAQR